MAITDQRERRDIRLEPLTRRQRGRRAGPASAAGLILGMGVPFFLIWDARDVLVPWFGFYVLSILLLAGIVAALAVFHRPSARDFAVGTLPGLVVWFIPALFLRTLFG